MFGGSWNRSGPRRAPSTVDFSRKYATGWVSFSRLMWVIWREAFNTN